MSNLISTVVSGRANVGTYTNKSGGTVLIGDVVVVDNTADAAFKTSTSAGDTTVLGVVIDAQILNNATGKVVLLGICETINVTGSVARGDYLAQSSSAKLAYSAGASLVSGCFAIAQTADAGGVVSARLFQVVGGAATGAPTDADYLVKTTNAGLSAERVVTDTAEIALDWATAGQAKFGLVAGGIANSKLANMVMSTFKARKTASTGAPEDATATEATALLNVMAGDAGAGGVKGLVPAQAVGDAAKFLRGDATFQTIVTSLGVWMPDAPPTSVGALDDEFKGASGGVPPGWTEADLDSRLTIVEDARGFVLFTMTAAATNNLAGMWVTDPTGDITFWAKVSLLGARVNTTLGIGWAQDPTSVTADYHIVRLTFDATGMYFLTTIFTAQNVFSSNPVSLADVIGSSSGYLRCRRTGTTYSFDFSTDGIGWIQLSTGSISFTPTKLGFWGYNNDASNSKVWLAHFFRSIASDVGPMGVASGRLV